VGKGKNVSDAEQEEFLVGNAPQIGPEEFDFGVEGFSHGI
jgi:hypothetical protein